jgi:DNA-directed RNA polymerase specialized sigma24 family protein
MSDLPTLISKAKSGQLDALAALIEALARDLRAFIATYATSLAMADEVHTATWIQVRKELSNCPPNAQGIIWVRQRAVGMLRNLLDAERSSAIAARDGLRHLTAQDGIEGLDALVSPSNEGAALLNQRYAALDEASQLLISRRYADGASLSELAGENGVSDGEVAKRLFSIRAGMHWRATEADKRPPDDPHLAVAIDQHLAGQLDAPGRQNLGTTLMKDLGRAAAFTRQVRIDLMLHAVFGAYTAEEARNLATILVKVEHKRRNESSLLQVVAPPRTPVGSGTELRLANDRIAERQTGRPGSGPAATAPTRPVPRTSRGAVPTRRGSSEENLLTRERQRRGKNRNQPLIIGGTIAAVGLIALIMLWGRSGGPATGDGPVRSGNIATIVATQGGAEIITGVGSRIATAGSPIASGDGCDSARGETTIELGGSVRLVLAPGTQVKSFSTLPDRTGQVHLTKGTLLVQVATTPGVEVRTAHGRVTFGIGRGQVQAESDRTQVHAQGGSVTVAGAEGIGAMQMPADQRVEILAGAGPRVLRPASFVRGINLGGNPVTIDRHRWLSHREALSAGLTLGPGTSIAPPSMFSGTGLDFDRKTMLDSGLTGSGGPVQFTQVLPDGVYELTFWLANTATLDVSHLGLTVNDQQIPLTGALLKRDTWAQLGPLPVRVGNGRMEIALGGQGAARVCGLALEASDGDRLALPAAVAITSPVEAATFFRGENITLRAETVGKLRSVQFFSGDKLLGEASKEPWSLAVDSLPAGDHRIVAKAVNLTGGPSVSLPQSFSVMEAFGSGTILVQRWTGLGGVHLGDVKDHPKTDGPSQQSVEAKEFATQLNWGDQYYCRIRGYIHPPVTGDYTFWMLSDDEGELLLSTSADPAQAKRIAHSPDATGSRDWTKHSSQQSKPVPLIAGQKYYIELRYKEHEGDDWGACGWKLPNGLMDRPISGAHLSPFKP